MVHESETFSETKRVAQCKTRTGHLPLWFGVDIRGSLPYEQHKLRVHRLQHNTDECTRNEVVM